MKKILYLIAMSFILSSCSEDKAEQAEITSVADSQIVDDRLSEEAKNGPQFQDPIPDQIVVARSFKVLPDDMFLGNRDAKVVLVEYFSPTCPHCWHYHQRTFPEIEKKYINTHKISYVFREFIANKQDFDASILARCKGGVGLYLKFIDVILKQQESWAFDRKYHEILTNIGSLGGVSPEEYAKCMSNNRLNNILMENTKLVVLDPKFVGTPSFFINGVIFEKPYTFEELSKALDAAIAND